MTALPESGKELIRSGALGHLVTIGGGGAPQVTCVWVGVDRDDLRHRAPESSAAQARERPPRSACDGLLRGTARSARPGLREYLVIHGKATIEEGGAAELLQELAHVHLGPEVRFPAMNDPPPGVRMRIAVERVGGIGPWAG